MDPPSASKCEVSRLHSDRDYFSWFLFPPIHIRDKVCQLVRQEHEAWQKKLSPPLPEVSEEQNFEKPYDTSWWVSRLTEEEKRILDRTAERSVWERLYLVKQDISHGAASMTTFARLSKRWLPMHDMLVGRAWEFHTCGCDGCEYHGFEIAIPKSESLARSHAEEASRWRSGPRVSCDGMEGWRDTRRRKAPGPKPKRKGANELVEVILFMHSSSQRIAHSRIKNKHKKVFLFKWSCLRQRYEDEAWAPARVLKEFYALARSSRL